MFYYLSGRVAVLESCLAVLDCGGVGYAVNTSMRSLAALHLDEEARLYTHCVIREDAFDIYGFSTQAELRSFRLLIGISGVGPKAALSILSSSSPEDLGMAIVAGNEKALTIAPGVGKKLAQRIILELKDKLGKELEGVEARYLPPAAAAAPDRKQSDVAAALAVLGYTPAEVNAALQKLDLSALSVEEAIRQVLKTALK